MSHIHTHTHTHTRTHARTHKVSGIDRIISREQTEQVKLNGKFCKFRNR